MALVFIKTHRKRRRMAPLSSSGGERVRAQAGMGRARGRWSGVSVDVSGVPTLPATGSTHCKGVRVVGMAREYCFPGNVGGRLDSQAWPLEKSSCMIWVGGGERTVPLCQARCTVQRKGLALRKCRRKFLQERHKAGGGGAATHMDQRAGDASWMIAAGMLVLTRGLVRGGMYLPAF